MKVRCQCGAALNVKDTAAGKRIKCPKCQSPVQVPQAPEIVQDEAAFAVAPAEPRRTSPAKPMRADDYENRSPAAVQQVRVEVAQPAKASNSLGIASIVLGILAFLICWIPFVGLLGLPLSVLGVVLGGVGLVLAIVRKGGGIGFPIAGTAVSGLAAVVTIGMTLLFTGAVQTAAESAVKAAENREKRAQAKIESKIGPRAGNTSQESGLDAVDPSPADGSGTEPEPAAGARSDRGPQWAGPEDSVTIGDVSYTIDQIVIGKVETRQIGGGAGRSQNPLFHLNVRISNLSRTRKLDFLGYADVKAGFLGARPRLTDNFGNSYKRIDFGFGSDVFGQVKGSESLFPGKTLTDVLVFEHPLDAATHLDLEIPAHNVIKEEGTIRFRIPASAIRFEAEESAAKPQPPASPSRPATPVASTPERAPTATAEAEPEAEPKVEPEKKAVPKITEEQRRERQAAAKLRLAKRWQLEDRVKARGYAAEAVDLAPEGSETGAEAQTLLDGL